MANEMTIDPKVDKSIKSVVKYANDAAIMNVDDMVAASEKVRNLYDLKNQIEAQRTEFTKPLNESLKKINLFFKKFTQPLDEADRVLREKLKACKNTLQGEQNQFGLIHFVTVPVITVDDIKKVPTEYLMVDERKVQAAIKSGVTNIKGLTISEDKRVSL